MEQTQKDNQDVVTIMSYGETYEKQTIKLLKVQCIYGVIFTSFGQTSQLKHFIHLIIFNQYLVYP